MRPPSFALSPTDRSVCSSALLVLSPSYSCPAAFVVSLGSFAVAFESFAVAHGGVHCREGFEPWFGLPVGSVGDDE